MAASPRPPSRRLTPLQIVLGLAAVVVVIVAEALLVRAYQAINTASASVETSGQLIGDIADLQRQLAQLDRLTDAALDDPGATFAEADARRSQLTTSVNTMASDSAGNQPVMYSLGGIKNTLSQYDAFLAKAKALPASQRAAAKPEVGLILDGLAQQTNALFEREQSFYLQTLRDNLAAQRAIQSTLIVMSLLLLTLGVGFVLSVGRSVRTEIDRSAGRLQVAADVGRAAISITDPDELIVRSVELIRDRFDLYYAALFLVDDEARWAVLRHATGDAGSELLRRGHKLEIGGQSMVGSAVSTRRARIALDVGREAVRFANPLLPDAHSEIALPLVVGDTVLGALDAQSTETNAFSDADITTLQTMADQIAIALQNARLLQQTNEARLLAESRLQETGELQRLSERLALSLGLDPTLDAMADAMVNIIGFDYCLISLVEEAGEWVRARRGVNVSPAWIAAAAQPLDSPDIMADVVRNNRTEIIEGVDPRFAADAAAGPQQHAALRRRVLSPILYRHRCIGIAEGGFFADSERGKAGGHVSQHEVDLLRSLLDQGAVAVQNARLFEESQRRASQLATAAEVGRAAISLTNPDELIVKAVELIRERFDLYYAAVFLVDAAGEWAVLRHATGEAGRALMERGHRLQVGGNSMVGAAISRREPRIALDAGAETQRFKNPLLPDTRSELALPLIVGSTILGAIDVQSTNVNAFSPVDMTVLLALADQIATALQNAQLYQESRRLAHREQTVNAISAKLRRLPTVESILTTALVELGAALGAGTGQVRIGTPQSAAHPDEPRGGDPP